MFVFFFFKQKTAYEMRISDWSSDVCSSDLPSLHLRELDLSSNALSYLPLTASSKLSEGIATNRSLLSLNLDFNQKCPEADDEFLTTLLVGKIGRASCRERVCQYV